MAIVEHDATLVEIRAQQFCSQIVSQSPAAQRMADSPRADSSALLAPMIREAIDQTDYELPDIDLVAATIGPGSFTGLRVGVVTAKTLAFALEKPVIGVDTLEVIAAQARGQMEVGTQMVCAVNAQRGQLFCGVFRAAEAGAIERVSPQVEIIDRQELLDRLQNFGVGIVSGPGLRPIEAELQSLAQAKPWTLAPPDQWDPTATTVGILGARHFQSGQRDDLWSLSPNYFRPSAAEEKANR